MTLYKVFHFSPQLESRSNELLSFQKKMVLTLQKSCYPQIHNNYTSDSQILRLQTRLLQRFAVFLGFFFCFVLFVCLLSVLCFVVIDVVLVGFVFEIGSPYVVPAVEEFYVDEADLKFTEILLPLILL